MFVFFKSKQSMVSKKYQKLLLQFLNCIKTKSILFIKHLIFISRKEYYFYFSKKNLKPFFLIAQKNNLALLKCFKTFLKHFSPQKRGAEKRKC